MKRSDSVPEMTIEQMNHAWHLRKQKFSWDKISQCLGIRRETITDTLYPERKIKKALSDKLYKAKTKANRESYAVGHRVKAVTYFDKAPEEVLAERERRELVDYDSFTSEFFGDPKPGYSALDKKRMQNV